ncbi:MAG: sigma-54-dependent Fis family transcriptional regulator [Planctomycetes bacterium]|nr:sigma-54-dependent Fis family transcriptional regulator [Planctomycetota bacterium]
MAVVSKNGMQGLSTLATRGGHTVQVFASWQDLHGADEAWDIVLADDEAIADQPDGFEMPIVLVSDAANANSGALGVLSPNAAEGALEAVLSMAVELQLATRRCAELEGLVDNVRSGSAMIGNSPVMRRLQGSLSRAADSDATVLIEGPTGAGKSLAARIVHCKSRRSGQAPKVVEATQLDADQLTAALAAAADTTLVIENIDRMPATGQAVLVRHLKERVSSRGPKAPRLVATTSAHLPELVARGAFREDLYYRLHTFPIVVPALRERTDDIVLIAEGLLAAAAINAPRTSPGLTPSAAVLLESMAWPGNVAQLEAIVRRALTLAGGAAIDREHLLAPASTTVAAAGEGTNSTQRESSSLDEPELTEDSIRPFEEEEQHLLSRALRATKGNVRRAAQLLGIGRATLYRKIQQYHLRLQ